MNSVYFEVLMKLFCKKKNTFQFVVVAAAFALSKMDFGAHVTRVTIDLLTAYLNCKLYFSLLACIRRSCTAKDNQQNIILI